MLIKLLLLALLPLIKLNGFVWYMMSVNWRWADWQLAAACKFFAVLATGGWRECQLRVLLLLLLV